MRRIQISALVAISVIAVSCAKEIPVAEKEVGTEIPMEQMCIQTTEDTGSQTKTILEGKVVKWTEGDSIAVYSNMDYSTGYVFPATNINGKSATFNGEVPAGTESFFAVYPPESVVSASASGAVVTIPSNQTPSVGTFGEELNITIAKGTKTPGNPSVGTIAFRNVCSYVKFTVPAYVSDVNSVTISSDNAIAGKLTVDYTGERPASTITSDGSKSISMSGSFGSGKTFIFVIAPGTVSNFNIDITTTSGHWTRTVSSSFTATAGKPVNLGTVDFKIAPMTATATHTYNGTTLTGTDLTIDNLNIAGYEDYVQKVHIDIIPKGQSTAVRSADITDFNTQTSIAVNSSEYPYLPQGTYTIKSTYTMSDGKTLRETSGEFSVPAPTFEITSQPTIYTSYSVYKSDNPIDGITAGASGANGLDGSSIYVKKGTVSIDGNLLTKYSSIASYTCTDGTTALNEGQNGNMGWSAHTVSSSFTFDGVTRNFNDVTCHVTGLPYRAPSETKFNASGKSWTKISGAGTEVNADNVVLKPTVAPKAYSPAFHIPADINVSINNTVTRNSVGSGYIYALNLYDGANTGTSIKSEKVGKGETKNYSGLTATMTKTFNRIVASYSYKYAGNYITIYKFEMLYK